MGCKTGIPSADRTTVQYELQQESIANNAPRKGDELIFDTTSVSTFLYGLSFKGEKSRASVLLEAFTDTSVARRTYEESFNEAIAKLLDSEEISELYNEIRKANEGLEFRRSDGTYSKISDLSIVDLRAFVSRSFGDYVSNGGSLDIESPTQEKVFSFLYDFYSNIDSNITMFTPESTGSIGAALRVRFDRESATEESLAKTELSAKQYSATKEGMSTILMNILDDTSTEGFMQALSVTDASTFSEMYGALGTTEDLADLQGTVAYELIGHYLTLHNQLSIEFERVESEYGDGHPKWNALYDELTTLELLIGLDGETGALDVSEGMLGKSWDALVLSSVAYLKARSAEVKIENTVIEDASLEDLVAEIALDDDINGQQSIGIVDDHKVNPISLMSDRIKVLLATLPEISGVNKNSYTFASNAMGLPKMADFGKVIATIYSVTSNKSNMYEMLDAINDLAQKENDYKYEVLLKRLGLNKDVDNVADLSAEQGDILLEFITAINNAQNVYTMVQISESGARNLENANTETAERVVKNRWEENFKRKVRLKYGTANADGAFTLDLEKEYVTTTGRKMSIGELMKRGAKTSDEAFGILEDLFGIKFSNLPALKEDFSILPTVVNTTNVMMFYLKAKEGDLLNIFKEDQGGRLRELINLQLESSNALGSLQFTSPSGTVFAITKKGFINVLADKLNSDVAFVDQLGNSVNGQGSVYLNKLALETEKIEIGVLMGAYNRQSSQDMEYSNMGVSDITGAQVSSILDGFVPLIRTGNKKLEKTIRVGKPDYSETAVQMIPRLMGYLRSEIITANAIKNGAANQIKGMNERGKTLQLFKDDAFEDLYAMADTFIDSAVLDESKLDVWLNSPDVGLTFNKYLKKETAAMVALLEDYNIIQNKGKEYSNIGLDNNQLSAIAAALGGEVGTTLTPRLVNKVAEQLVIIRTTSIHEQFKIFLGHPAVYGDIFKRTSGLVGPKKYPIVHSDMLQWTAEHYENGETRRARSVSDGVVKMVTMEDVLETSTELDMYRDVLESMERLDVWDSVEDAHTDMEIFDGGGFIHIDFYRLSRRLTGSWGPREESAYQTLITGGDMHSEALALFDPLKPQVLAQTFEKMGKKSVDIRLFHKFALFPIHPGLSKTLTDLKTGQTNMIDSIYEDMNKNGLDYMVMGSASKAGAKKGVNGFNNFIDESGTYEGLKDVSAIQTYGLEYFGMQMDPKGKQGVNVTVGTQSTSMLPTNIYHNGELAKEYQGEMFSETETWEQAIDRYHALNASLINREAIGLASKLGFTYNLEGGFKFLGDKTKMRDTLLDEMDKREIPDNVKAGIVDLFTRDVTFAGQLFDKEKIETILNAVVTNTVVRRKMHGDMVVLQSNFGYELTGKAEKQGTDISDSRKLKTYSKDVDPSLLEGKTKKERQAILAAAPTTAMEVYLPHHYRAFLGKDLPAGAKISVKALQAVGFRIPTEGLNSIEFMIIKDFLPLGQGSNIIVPSEIVAKSGADFDIDKLTLYLPNTEYNKDTNTIDVLQRVSPTLEGMNSLFENDIEALRSVISEINKNDPTALRKTMKELDSVLNNLNASKEYLKEYAGNPSVKAFVKAREALTELIRTSEGKKKKELIVRRDILVKKFNASETSKLHILSLKQNSSAENKLDTLLISLVRGAEILVEREGDTVIQPKGVLQNDLIDFITDVMSHPLSFPQVITPVGASTVKTIAKEIDALKNPGRWEMVNGKLTEKLPSLHEMMSFRHMIETTNTMYQTLGGTGVVASGITHAAKAQRAGLRWDHNTIHEETYFPDRRSTIKFNFDVMQNEELTLARTTSLGRDSNGNVRFINAEMQQYITGYVDGEKDPFVMYVNAGKSAAAIHMTLLRTGIPLETVLYFMSQPIISDYLKAQGMEKSLALKASNGSKSNTAIIETLITTYGGETKDIDTFLSLSDLKGMVAKSPSTMSGKQRGLQVQILKDFLRYKEYGDQLRDVQAVNSYDKMKLKNGAEVLHLEALEEVVDERGYFLNHKELVTESMQGSVLKVLHGTATLFQDVDLKNSNNAIRGFFKAKAKEMIRAGKFKDDIIFTLNKFDNFLMTEISHKAQVRGREVHEMVGPIMKGPDSVPKQIQDLQENGETNNLLIDNFLPVLDTYGPEAYNSLVDNLKLISKKYDVQDVNSLVQAAEELRDINPKLYNDLMLMSLLQNGMDFGPNAFHMVFPAEDVLNFTEDAFLRVQADTQFTYRLKRSWDNFIYNNWNTSKVVKQIYLYENEEMLDKWSIDPFDKTFSKLHQNARYVALTTKLGTGSDVTYRTELFGKRFNERSDTEEYVKMNKKGKNGRVIEVGMSILPSNTTHAYTAAHFLGREAIEKIESGEKTLHAKQASDTFKEGRYKLPTGTSIHMAKILGAGSSKVLNTSISKKALLKDSTLKTLLGIHGKTDTEILKKLSKSLGFGTLQEMKNKYPDFFSKSLKLSFFTIVKEERDYSREEGLKVMEDILTQEDQVGTALLDLTTLLNEC